MKLSNMLTMPTNKTLSAFYIVIVLVVTAIALMVLFHKSILVYCQQSYHFEFFDMALMVDDANVTEDDQTKWTNESYESEELENTNIEKDNQKHPNVVTANAIADKQLQQNNRQNKTIKSNHTTENNKQKLPLIKGDNLQATNKRQTHSDSQLDSTRTNTALGNTVTLDESSNPRLSNDTDFTELSPIVLTKNDKVLFAGDSLMQGVAPYVKKMLFKQYKIESINLSKQSTGLAYPKAFDWPKTINDSISADASIKLIVIFLGPNDPWDFPVKGYAKYAKFKSQLWEEQYRLRVASILDIANQHNVKVLWLSPPCMRKPKLNDGMNYLSHLYESEVEKAHQHFMETNTLLGCSYDQFNSYIETNKQKIKVRIDDGIHFTITGQKLLAQAILNQITSTLSEDSHIESMH
ncbi:DUF459 domain-containing protein [Gilliamella sp. CG25]|uniref:SGNH/GDSL hydrolase family protein n=1 Tax=unclassified Gilliamella TaxID=2685620 RepID=UPI003987862C